MDRFAVNKQNNPEAKRICVTWGQVTKMCNQLVNKMVMDKFNPKSIVGIPRGGFIPACIIAHIFHRTRNEVFGTQDINEIIRCPMPVLVVDEVVDTGGTLNNMFKMINSSVVTEIKKSLGDFDVRVAALHMKPWSNFKPDYYIKETADWIVYPWERD